jgi:hypothetical protein
MNRRTGTTRFQQVSIRLGSNPIANRFPENLTANSPKALASANVAPEFHNYGFLLTDSQLNLDKVLTLSSIFNFQFLICN